MSVSSRSSRSSRASTDYSYNRRSNIEIVTEAIPFAPEPPRPNYNNLTRRGSFVRERRPIVARVEDRVPVPDNIEIDTLSHQYRQLAKRPLSVSSSPVETYATLVPTNTREIARIRYDGAAIIDRAPVAERTKPAKKAKVVEKKETVMMRDSNGNWYKVKRTIKP